MRNPNKTQGFTLVEILIATVILFASITAIMMVYKGALLSNHKAEMRIEASTYLPSIVRLIQDDIQQQSQSLGSQLTGQGQQGDVAYSWQAERLSFAAAPEYFDMLEEEFVKPEKRYMLWQVTLILSVGNRRIEYDFQSFSWLVK